LSPERIRVKPETMECLMERVFQSAGFVCVYDGSQPKDINWLDKPTFFTRVYRCKMDGEWINTWVKFVYDLRPGKEGQADFEMGWKDLTVFNETKNRQQIDLMAVIKNGNERRLSVRLANKIKKLFNGGSISSAEPQSTDTSGIDDIIKKAEKANVAGIAASTKAKLESRVEGVATTIANKTLKPQLERMSLPQQVKASRGMMAILGKNKTRSSMINGFASEFLEKRDKGMSGEEILHPYLNCPEFIQFWHDLGMNETDLRNLMPDGK
jgi:hypothetical protein